MSGSSAATDARKRQPGAGTYAIFALVIVVILATAVAINIVLSGNAGMWAMTLFGAVIICIIIAGAALHSIRESNHR